MDQNRGHIKMTEFYDGRWGTAQLVNNFGNDVSVALWFLIVPEAHPLWSHYLLSIVSLDQKEGYKEPYKSYPEAEYELVVLPLDREHNPIANEPDSWCFLTPVNLAIQFHGVTREQAAELASNLALDCVIGTLSVEVQGLYGMRELWNQIVEARLQKYRGAQ